MSVTRLVQTDKLKEEIASKLQISDVAERLCGVELQRSGHQWVGLCPLHDENTGSFYVNDSRGVFNCFGCKQGGDSIKLVREKRNLGYIETLYLLAAEADIDISEYERPLTEEEQIRERLRNACETWLSTLQPDQVRRVDSDTCAAFGVGWTAKGSIDGVQDWLTRGVIFPYRLPNGVLVGWKARERDQKKMYGTPADFPLHQETLFGIQVAREHADGRLVIVEGEYDCLTAHAAGFRNVVALGGSALTPEQMQLADDLRMREVVVILDGDDGGRIAAKTICERYWAHDVMVRVAVCDEGEDPDSLIKKYGELAFDVLVRNARHALEHLLWIEWQSRTRESLASKLEFVTWIRETYGAKLRSTDESLVLQEVAKWLQIPEVEVRDFVRASDTSLQATDSERVLLGKAMRDRNFFNDLRKRFVQIDFYMVKHQRIWDILSRMMVDGLTFDVPTLGRFCEAEGIQVSVVEGLVELPDGNMGYHEEQVLDMSLRRSARDEALKFKNQILDLNQDSDSAVSELTHRITERALRKKGQSQRLISEQVDKAVETIHARMRNPTEVHGLDLGTQFPALSQTLQGLQPQRLVLLSAASGIGKSTMMIQWAASLSVHQAIPTDMVSLEMDETEILTKMASHMTGVDSMKISGGRLEPAEVKAVEQAMKRIRMSPLHIWAPDGINAVEFLLYARESCMTRKTEAFFIDYIQLTDPDPGMERDNGYTQYGHFGRMVKMKVARAMDVSVICCAQLRREAANKERPTKEDMGDSYALVRHADVILILISKEDSSDVDLYVDKNRQGIGGNVNRPMVFDRPTNTFREMTAPKTPEYLIRV